MQVNKYYTPVPKMEKHCDNCGTLFIGSKNKVYCSATCRSKHTHERFYRPVGMRMFECEYCKQEFSSERKQRFCTKDCRAKSTLKNHPTVIKTCPACLSEFSTSKPDKKYCSEKCHQKSWSASPKKKASMKAWRERNPDRRYTPKPKEPKPIATRIFIKTCEITGQVFVTRNRNKRFSQAGYQLFKKTQSKHSNTPKKRICIVCSTSFMGTSVAKVCSEECRSSYSWNKHAQHRGQKSAAFEFIDRHKVFEQYDWHCGACNCHTPPATIGTNAQNEPTIDHIIPLSQGGSHTYDNVQMLCRSCNTAKSDLLDTPNDLIATTSMYYQLKQQIHVTEQQLTRSA